MADVCRGRCETSRVTREPQTEATAGTVARPLEWLTSKNLTVTNEGSSRSSRDEEWPEDSSAVPCKAESGLTA